MTNMKKGWTGDRLGERIGHLKTSRNMNKLNHTILYIVSNKVEIKLKNAWTWSAWLGLHLKAQLQDCQKKSEEVVFVCGVHEEEI